MSKVVAKLYGGPNDGESIYLLPNGSMQPPARVQYVYGTGWATYEVENTAKAQWPEKGLLLFKYKYVEPDNE